MMQLQRLLFPTDGSACAERARRYAMAVADRFDAELHVIHVDERDAELPDVIDIDEDDLLDQLHLPVDEPTPVAASRIRERRVVHRSAAGGILSYAAEHDTALTVMGTHGRRGVQRLLLGSVTEAVVRRAPDPVMTVGKEAGLPDDIAGGRLLVPVDFSEHQSRLLSHAREWARAYDLSLTLLHVVALDDQPAPSPPRLSAPDPDALRTRTTEALEEAAAPLRDADLTVDVAVHSGHPADQILNAAADAADLLAIATHGRTGLERVLMGSVAEAVIRQAPCPVFTVKSFGHSLVHEADA